MTRAKLAKPSLLLGLSALSLLGLVNCAGKLENAEDFPEHYYPPGQCVVEDVFYRRCGGSTCHNNTGLAAGSLMLATPNARANLIDKPALHTGVLAGSICPMDDLYVNTQNWQESWLLKKIQDEVGTCGLPMP